MQQILEFMIKLSEQGYVPKDAITLVVKKFMDIFGFGSTQEFMDAMDSDQMPINEENITQIKVAIAETAKDLGLVGPEHDQKLVDSTKLGVIESLKQSGILDKIMSQDSKPQDVAKNPVLDDMVKIYKDSSSDIRRQIEMAMGLQPSTQEPISPSSADTINKLRPKETKPPLQKQSNGVA